MDGDITLDEAISFFRSAGFVVVTDEELWGGCPESEDEDED